MPTNVSDMLSNLSKVLYITTHESCAMIMLDGCELSSSRVFRYNLQVIEYLL